LRGSRNCLLLKKRGLTQIYPILFLNVAFQYHGLGNTLKLGE
jgi:hypothetical protein